jgi:hypothetical protein
MFPSVLQVDSFVSVTFVFWDIMVVNARRYPVSRHCAMQNIFKVIKRYSVIDFWLRCHDPRNCWEEWLSVQNQDSRCPKCNNNLQVKDTLDP